ncbi:MAG TPA: hypothetical protein ACFYD7_00300 [Candidatus Wujingus californicus]|uniref:hypothetical protein n=1 Tax=Candidatus Wujingus californicus TaxID=3367618 RepID=UPI001D424AE7|nr:hypothetical protein [Planctomycetota bacterium]MDO8132209.1 hypothetical protein [Candidatus Brocadiales bacterium]
MKQYEAVIKVMESKGGYATLGSLYQEVLKIRACEWKTKTPFASIRRIVQDERFFFKIRPGLWALKTYRDKLPFDILPIKDIPKQKQEEFSHTYFQGLLVEIGNLKEFETYVPNQDKNKIYLGKRLEEISSVKDYYQFTYNHIIQRARTIDVTWFNVRKMPSMFFEVEHAADIYNSLLKFVELQDFYTDFYIVASDVRKKEFESKIVLEAFRPIQKRIRFMSYNDVSEWHSKTYQIISFENSIGV